jgi:hypothetical protein
MSLKDLLKNDLDTVFFDPDGLAEAAEYNGTKILVIPQIGEGDAPETRRRMAFFRIKAADVPEPQLGDILLHKGVEWQLAGIAESSTLTHRIRCFAEESAVLLGRC